MLSGICQYFFQTLANTYFSIIDARVGISSIPNTTNQIYQNNRCSYLPIGAKDNAEVMFDCGTQGIWGSTISLQNRYFNLSLLEVEFLGKLMMIFIKNS